MTALRLALVALSLTVGAQAQEPQPPAAGRIAGRVVAGDTGKPIPRAEVRLVSQRGQQRYASTGADGRYEFKDLAAGVYRLTVSADRYVILGSGDSRSGDPGRTIQLREGQNYGDADATLHRAGAIEGVLLDEFGDPAPNVSVHLSQSQFGPGYPVLMPVGGQSRQIVTDDKGRYRFFGLLPGQYFVLALSGAFTESNQSGGFVPTYYPGTPDVSEAKPIRLAAAQEITTVNFNLVPGPMARVSGRLLDPDGAPVPGGPVSLVVSYQGRIRDIRMARTGSNRDGTFLFRSVPPGTFTIQAFGRPEGGGNLARAPFGWLNIIVDGKDLTDLAVKVSPGAKLRGRIVFDRDGALPKPSDVLVFPRPVEYESNPLGGGPPPSVVRDDWTFEISNMFGLRVVRGNSRNVEWTLKAITLDGVDVADKPLDFRKGDIDGLEVVFTRGNASVEGTVTTADGQPAPNYAVIVFAANPARLAFPSRFIRLARPDQEGRFRVTGLPPEDYFAVAVSDIAGGEWEDPELLNRLRSTPQTASFSLLEGDRKTLELKLHSPR